MKRLIVIKKINNLENYMGWRIFLKIFFLKFLIKVQEAFKIVPDWYISEQFGKKLSITKGILKSSKLGNSETKRIMGSNEKFFCEIFGSFIEFKLEEEKFKHFDYMLGNFFLSFFLLCSEKKSGKTIFSPIKKPSVGLKTFKIDHDTKKKFGPMRIFSGNIVKNFKIQRGKISKKENRLTEFKRRFKANRGFIEFPLVLKILNNLLYKKSIKGFTREALRIVIYHLNTFIRDLILKLGQISINRQKKTKRYSHEWGIRNIVKKNPLKNLKEKKPKFKKDLKLVLRSFKKKKILKNPNTKNSDFRQDPKPIKVQNSKKGIKANTLEENISKTNKTLMALLDGIFKRRIRILKDATKNLNKYKPTPSKIIAHKEIKIEENFDKTTNISGNSISLKKFKEGSFLSGNDCLNLMRNREEIDNKDIFLKFFFSLTLDYNLGFSNINLKQ